MLSFAEAEAETLMPGYTHLQRGQPVTLGHHLLAWVEMLDRDRTRFAAAAEAAAESPLGAGALAGSTLGIDPPESQMRNSIDAVVRPRLRARLPLCGRDARAHLSRIGEEIVLWSTVEFGFVRLPENASTGSSMMPQKLNPDVAELVRGKARNGDRAPRRPPRDGERPAARLRPRPAGGQAARVRRPPRRPRLAPGNDRARQRSRRDRERLAEAVADPLLLATDVAEDLVRGGIPFREAHEQVAASVRDGTFSAGTTAAESVAARPSPGPGGVRDAVAAARKRFGQGV